jgi:hypothetical protein
MEDGGVDRVADDRDLQAGEGEAQVLGAVGRNGQRRVEDLVGRRRSGRHVLEGQVGVLVERDQARLAGQAVQERPVDLRDDEHVFPGEGGGGRPGRADRVLEPAGGEALAVVEDGGAEPGPLEDIDVAIDRPDAAAGDGVVRAEVVDGGDLAACRGPQRRRSPRAQRAPLGEAPREPHRGAAPAVGQGAHRAQGSTGTGAAPKRRPRPSRAGSRRRTAAARSPALAGKSRRSATR